MKLIVGVLATPVLTFAVVSLLAVSFERLTHSGDMAAPLPVLAPGKPAPFTTVHPVPAISRKAERGGAPGSITGSKVEEAAGKSVEKPAIEQPAAPATPPVPSEVLAGGAASPEVPVASPGAGPAGTSQTSDDAVWMIDDFEKEATVAWKAANWGNPALLSVRDGALKIEMMEGKADKVAIMRSLRADLSHRDQLVLDVMNDTPRAMALAVAIVGGESARYLEAPGVQIKPGLNQNVVFDLKARTFKCAESEWKHNMPLDNATAVKQLFFLIYGRGAGDVFIDNVGALAAQGQADEGVGQ